MAAGKVEVAADAGYEALRQRLRLRLRLPARAEVAACGHDAAGRWLLCGSNSLCYVYVCVGVWVCVCVCSVCGCALGKCCSFVCCLFYNSFFNAHSLTHSLALAGLRCDFCRRHCRVVPSLTLLCGACDPHPLHVHVL